MPPLAPQFAALMLVSTFALTAGWIVTRPAITELPETVVVAPGTYSYRPAGTYRYYGKLVDAPLTQERSDDALEIMKYQVSRAEYAAFDVERAGRCHCPAACLKL